MKRAAFISAWVCGGLLGGCSGAGDADLLKFDGGDNPAPSVDAPASEAQPPLVVTPAVPCDPATPCTDAVLNYCYVTSAGVGYCTSTGCADASTCPTGWFCDLALAPSLCRRPPTGEGAACTAAQDCAQFEASYCETMVSRSCLVSGCSPQLNNCDDAHLCCDFATLGLPSLCVEKALLPGGKCTQ